MKPLTILLGVAVIGGTGLFGYGSGMFNPTSATLDASSMMASGELPASAPETPFASGSSHETVAGSEGESALKNPSIEKPVPGNESSGSSLMDRVVAKKPATTNGNEAAFSSVSSKGVFEPAKTVTQDVQEKKASAPDKNQAKKRVPLKPVPTSKPSVITPSTNQPTGRQPLIKQPGGTKGEEIGKTTGEAAPRAFRGGAGTPQPMNSEVLPNDFENGDANRNPRPRKDRDDVSKNQRPKVIRPDNVRNKKPSVKSKTNQKPPAKKALAGGPQLADVPPLQAPSGVDQAVPNRRPNQDRVANPAQRGTTGVQRRPAQPDRGDQRPARPDVQRQRPNTNSNSRKPRNNRNADGIQTIQEDNSENLEAQGKRNRNIGPGTLTPPPLEIPGGQNGFRRPGMQKQQGNNQANRNDRRATPPQRERGPGVAMDVTEVPRNGNANANRRQSPKTNRGQGGRLQPMDSSATPQDNNRERPPKREPASKPDKEVVAEKAGAADKEVKPATFDSDVKSKKEAYEEEMETLREKFDRLKREYDALTGKK